MVKKVKIEEPKSAPKKAAKPNKAPPARGSVPGDNLIGALTDDQRRGLFLNGIGKLERLQEAAASAAAAARKQRQVLKSEGFEKGDVDFALWTRKADENDVRKLLGTQARVLRYLAHPVATQASLFDETDRTPAVDRAYEEGKSAGIEGKRLEPPHDASTPQGQKWIAGWHDGQAVLASGFKPVEPKGMPSAPVEPETSEKVVRPRFSRKAAADPGATLN